MKQKWEVKKLGDIASYVNGFAFKPSDWEEEGIPIIRIQNLNDRKSKYNYSNRNLDGRYVVSNGDILIAWSGSLGVFIWKDDRAYLNQHIFKVVFDKIDINKFYFKYAIEMILNEMTRLVHGSTMKHITKRKFENIPVPVPPIEVQEEIVKELDTLHFIKEKQEEQLAEYDNLAQSTFYSMFGDPIDNEKGWEVRKLGEVCETKSGGTPSRNNKNNFNNGSISWLRSGEINKMFISESEYKITEEGLKNSSAKLFPIGTVLIAMYGATVGQVGILSFESATNQAICGILPNKHFKPEVLYFIVSLYKLELLRLAIGVAQPNISQKIIRNIYIPIPPLSLQEKFSERIEHIEAQKELLKKSIEDTQLLIDYTMDKYFG